MLPCSNLGLWTGTSNSESLSSKSCRRSNPVGSSSATWCPSLDRWTPWCSSCHSCFHWSCSGPTAWIRRSNRWTLTVYRRSKSNCWSLVRWTTESATLTIRSKSRNSSWRLHRCWRWSMSAWKSDRRLRVSWRSSCWRYRCWKIGWHWHSHREPTRPESR